MTPASADAATGCLSTESSTTDLLACGLFEDELNDLLEIAQTHSPKVSRS